jgi:hypothetical protein
MSEMSTGEAAFLAARAAMPMPPSVPRGMRLELAPARIKPGKSARANEWMAMLNARYDECVATLPGEQMAFEAIFRMTEADGTDWIYHLSLGGEGGSFDEQSGSLDADHAAFSRECKEPGWELITPQFLLVPDAVRAAILRAGRQGAAGS